MTDPSTSFDVFSPYWDLLEHGGLNEKIVALVEHIESPLLVVGSGQGLVSHTLLGLGYEVTSVDISEAMIRRARERRDVETIQADAWSLSLDTTFNTILVSTGIITETNVRTSMGKLLDSLDRHLNDGGTVILAYFRHTTASDAFERLGLLSRPSNNGLLFREGASLETFKERLIADGHDRAKLDFLFLMYDEEIGSHRELLANLVIRYVALTHAEPPADFLDSFADFGPCYLKPDSERVLLDAVDEKFVKIDELQPDDSARVIVLRRK